MDEGASAACNFSFSRTFYNHKLPAMRISLFLLLSSLMATMACKKESSDDERWLEESQRQETIIFNDGTPTAQSIDDGHEHSFSFQCRPLPLSSSVASPSGIYFYTLEEDSLVLRNSQRKIYFKMSPDGKSFTIGRFFPNYTGLQDLLIFRKQ
jgi:hypothetical protein